VFDSAAFRVMTTALDGLSTRQRVIADNIANIEVPGFSASRVTFEDALAASYARGSGDAPISVSRSLEPAQTNGNNVNLDEETLLNIDTNLRYQLATQAVGHTFTNIRTAIGR